MSDDQSQEDRFGRGGDLSPDDVADLGHQADVASMEQMVVTIGSLNWRIDILNSQIASLKMENHGWRERLRSAHVELHEALNGPIDEERTVDIPDWGILIDNVKMAGMRNQKMRERIELVESMLPAMVLGSEVALPSEEEAIPGQILDVAPEANANWLTAATDSDGQWRVEDAMQHVVVAPLDRTRYAGQIDTTPGYTQQWRDNYRPPSITDYGISDGFDAVGGDDQITDGNPGLPALSSLGAIVERDRSGEPDHFDRRAEIADIVAEAERSDDDE